MNKEELKEKGKSLLDYNESRIHEMKEWIEHFPLTGRCPKGQKENLSKLKSIKSEVDMFQQYGLHGSNIKAVLTYWDEIEIENIVDSFIKSEKNNVFKYRNIEFSNKSPLSEKAFLAKCKDLVQTINSLDGFHARAMEGSVKISFVGAKDIRSLAKYDSENDEVLIKHTSLSDNELYGHMRYLLVHELGHRYENKFGLPESFSDDWYRTTKYSFTESLSGSSEAFAEVFAVSHWPEKYNEYSDTINRFSTIMNEYTPKLKVKKDFALNM
ncbi:MULTISPECIES: hypothetical protein [Vibrio]|uniref:Uncharacterized protein n=2 Tax=Vibrio TaxID=662 RepID=A0AAX0M3G1_VIBPH|nr:MULTISPECIES: hypothetical protein [Vibrio]EJG0767275.1 hypothetical protein [Vibrio parahaemolyticus O5:K30]MCA2471789.1 hypothetical protein [Vibrio alginolyticus]MCS0328073.1 hypothetical protein [Vibrio diabolicus]TVM95353.1 hypothetical protein FPV63_24660 [Vibrio cholerae]ARN69948.1 hypothetical protein FORC36_5431 [Vibrio vulnificus]